nr:hypothetical transcript [Hymenolepis microstoma]
MHRVSPDYPTFDPTNPNIWFLQLKSTLRLRGVAKQGTLFQEATITPLVNVASQITNIISKTPENNCNNISCLTTSREKRLHQFFSQVELGDHTPSQLLRHKHLLASGYELDEEIL